MKTLSVLLSLLLLLGGPVGFSPAKADSPADPSNAADAAGLAGPAASVSFVGPAGLADATGPALPHVFYVSVTRVKWHAEEARLGVTVRIFTDDLEEAIMAEGGPRLRLWTGQAHEDRDRHVADYLAARLAFRVNGEDRKLAYAGMEDALDATACLVQITDVGRVESIEVENRILIDMFDTQANVMRFDVAGEKKFVNLSKKNFKGTVRFGS